MIPDIQFLINDQPVEMPENIGAFVIDACFDRDKTRVLVGSGGEFTNVQVATPEWHFVRETAKIIYDTIKAGHIFVGLPFKIKVNNVTVFDGYLNLKDNVLVNRKDGTYFSGALEAKVKASLLLAVEWISGIANAYTFYYWHDNGVNFQPYYKYLGYVISTLPKGLEGMMALTTGFVMFMALRKELADVRKSVAKISALSWWDVIGLTFDIIQILFVITMIIEFIMAFFTYMIQRVKYHSGMLVVDLLKIGFNQLGLQFDSKIVLKNSLNPSDTTNYFPKLMIIPQKYQLKSMDSGTDLLDSLGVGSTSTMSGYTEPNGQQFGFYKFSFGQLIEDIKKLTNSKLVIKNGVATLARWDYIDSKNDTAVYKLKALRNDFERYNTEDMKASMMFKFQTDLNDKNTFDQYKGTLYQVITSLKNPPSNQYYSLLAGEQTIDFPFALAKTKKTLTLPEHIYNGISNVLNAIIQVAITAVNVIIDIANTVVDLVNDFMSAIDWIFDFGWTDIEHISTISSNPIPTNPADDRIGMMLLENDYLDTSKILVLDEDPRGYKYNKINQYNDQILSAKNIYNNFYQCDTYVPQQDYFDNAKLVHNQWIKPEPLQNVPCTVEEANIFSTCQYLQDDEGNVVRIISFKYDPWHSKADIEYKYNKVYTDELALTFVEPDGN